MTIIATDAAIAEAQMRESAISFAARVLRTATDWQDAQHALADHPVFRPWLDTYGDPLATAQGIVIETEQRLLDLGEELPY